MSDEHETTWEELKQYLWENTAPERKAELRAMRLIDTLLDQGEEAYEQEFHRMWEERLAEIKE